MELTLCGLRDEQAPDHSTLNRFRGDSIKAVSKTVFERWWRRILLDRIEALKIRALM